MSLKKNKSFAKIIFEVFLYSITVILLVGIGIAFFSGISQSFNYQTYLIQSGSMEPSIRVGDIILVKSNADYVENDVITFHDQNRVITHRIIEKKIQNDQQIYRTKGDANNTADLHEITLSNIKGKVIFIVPKIGYLVRFSQSKLGIIALILAPIIIIIYEEINKILFQFKKNSHEN